MQRNIERLCAVGGIVEGNGTHFAALLPDVFGQHIGLAFTPCHVRLKSQGILVEGYQFRILQQCQRSFGDGGEVAADKQRRTHDAPHPEVCFFFRRRQSAAYFKHIHVVVVSVSGIGRKVEVFCDDVSDRTPVRRNVRTDAP